MAFRDIIGHTEVIENLIKKIKRGHLHHAILFYGPQGIGKRTLAMEFIKSINCKNFENEPCDTCNNCKWINEYKHPDIIIITNGLRAESIGIKVIQQKETSSNSEVEEESPSFKKEITINQIRYVEDLIYTRPIEAKYRVIFIIDAETLNKNAANAFLKTLEEPPENTIIVMTSSYLGMVPSTIRSRTEKIRLKPLSNIEMQKLLIEKINYSSENINIVLHLLKGGLNRKILNIDDNTLKEYLKIIIHLIKSDKLSVEEIIDISNFITQSSNREEKENNIYVFFTILKEILLDIYLDREKKIWGEYAIHKGKIKLSLIENINETIKFIRRSQSLYCNQNISIKSELLRLTEQWNRLSV